MGKYNLNGRTCLSIIAAIIASNLFGGCSPNPTPVLSIQPAKSLADQPVSIRLAGFKPKQEVTIRASIIGFGYESQATFLTDAHGSVDLGQQAPLSGSYTMADDMGLFWSMTQNPAQSTPTSTDLTPTTQKSQLDLPIEGRYLFTAEVDGQVVAQANAVRTEGLPGMSRIDVHEDGLYGMLYMPPGAGPFPAIITLGGSGGGLETDNQSLMLASHGYASLALVYLDRLENSDLPASLRMIPLEYFGKAIQWLQSQPGVDPNRIGIFGWSRGGEAALLVAATYPQIKAVVSYVAYTIVLPGEADTSQATSSWSYQGQPVPFLADDWAEYRVIHPFLVAVAARQDALPLIPGIVTQMDSTPAIVSAAIPVEKVNGPILLISGLDDRLVPSALFADFAIHHLAAHHFPFPYRDIINPGAGHDGIGFPYLPEPPDDAKRSPNGDWLGGSAQADANAKAVAWPIVLEYFGMMK